MGIHSKDKYRSLFSINRTSYLLEPELSSTQFLISSVNSDLNLIIQILTIVTDGNMVLSLIVDDEIESIRIAHAFSWLVKAWIIKLDLVGFKMSSTPKCLSTLFSIQLR